MESAKTHGLDQEGPKIPTEGPYGSPPNDLPDLDIRQAESWTDDEVVGYYEKHLSGLPSSSLKKTELKVITLHGQIATNRRANAEQAGLHADHEQIRRLVSVQVDSYAMAAELTEAHALTVKNVRLS